MEKWRTKLDARRERGSSPAAPIDHHTPVMLIGSCFSDEIGERLSRGLFDVAVNPFGTLFNPVSIAQTLTEALDGRQFTDADLFEREGLWHTLRRSTAFSGPGREETLRTLNGLLDRAAADLRRCRRLIVTFGSAIGFVDRETGITVANCHKLPQSRFLRVSQTVDDITAAWTGLAARLADAAPGLRLTFTVSPVRHVGYGLEADRLSKSVLRVAVSRLCELIPGADYFPAYEAVVDDLRDYRFYADDLVHPSRQAVDYVYEIFSDIYMTDATRQLAAEASALGLRAAHRHRNPALADDFRRQTLLLASRLPGPLPQRFNNLYPNVQDI